MGHNTNLFHAFLFIHIQQTNERLRSCGTMKRPEPPQDFEKTIQRVNITVIHVVLP